LTEDYCYDYQATLKVRIKYCESPEEAKRNLRRMVDYANDLFFWEADEITVNPEPVEKHLL